ncbi:MAG: hypothetical protein ABH883_09320 [Candidatus Omnitrophota bacterium]
MSRGYGAGLIFAEELAVKKKKAKAAKKGKLSGKKICPELQRAITDEYRRELEL